MSGYSPHPRVAPVRVDACVPAFCFSVMSWKTAATAVYTAYFQSAGACHLEESPTVLRSRVQLGWGGGGAGGAAPEPDN